MATSQPSLHPTAGKHLHIAGALCPYCDQPIPNDKAEEIRARFEAKERERVDALKALMNQQLAQERAQIEANAKAALEKVRQESAAALEMVNVEAAAKEVAAREEGRQSAEAVSRTKIAELEQAKTALESAMNEKLAEAQRGKQESDSRYQTLKANHDNEVNQRVQQAREALEKDKTDALGEVNARHFEETQKLTGKLAELQRQLEKKTADELGEGAEIKLFERLKAEFPHDRITRVNKGTSGADIIHVVIHNGKDCGTIVYDSKNRNVWRYDYVTKLRDDQIAAKAEHAILSTCKFPADAHQLEIRDGVIIANPARVMVVAEILRGYIVQSHELRVSGQERGQKTAALYSYITSEQFKQHLDSIDSNADKMLDLDVSEKKAHEAMWEKRGRLIKTVQKTHGNMRADIDRIIGTAESAE